MRLVVTYTHNYITTAITTQRTHDTTPSIVEVHCLGKSVSRALPVASDAAVIMEVCV